MNILLILTLLLIKHFICDFPLQTSYQLHNKGKYGHPGGLLHGGIHGAGTLCVLICFTPLLLAVKLALLDALIHYHIDWGKNKLNTHLGFTSKQGAGFWITFGFDQLLHQLTYVMIVVMIG